MNRRDSIKALGLAAAGTGLLIGSCRQDAKDSNTAGTETTEALPGVQDVEHARNMRLQQEQFFSPHELATITVLADVIIPKDAVSGSASEAGVPAFIEFIVKDIPDHQLPMRGGLKWLDVQCLKRFDRLFIDCIEEDQLRMVDEIAYPDKAKPDMQQGVVFFSLMRDLTASGFFTSEMGLKDIGYLGNRPGVWEGVPADVLREHGFI